MREKLKKIFNNKIFMFIFGGVLFSAVSVYAVSYFPSNQVTYDNSSSKLSSTNVQGAIDELYNVCSKTVSSGDYFYFSSHLGGIYRMSKNGGMVTKIQGTGSMQNIANFASVDDFAVTDDYIYFTSTSSLEITENRYPIYRMSVNGGDVTYLQGSGNYGATSLFVDKFIVSDDYIYFTSNTYNEGTVYRNPIYRMSVNGGDVTYLQGSGNYSNYAGSVSSFFLK